MQRDKPVRCDVCSAMVAFVSLDGPEEEWMDEMKVGVKPSDFSITVGETSVFAFELIKTRYQRSERSPQDLTELNADPLVEGDWQGPRET